MMVTSLVEAYATSIFAFALFGLLHSIGAQEPFKDALARLTGRFFVAHFWRLFYCGLSYWALYYGIATLHWTRNLANDVWLVAYPDWLWQCVIVLHLVSIVFVYAAFLQSDYLEFLGVRQAHLGLLKIFGKAPKQSKLVLFGTHRLEVKGVYGWVRHPMLAAGLLFLLTSGPSLNNIVYTAMYATYMVIGGYYEEKRLLKIFPDDYRRYRRRGGAYIPLLWRRQEKDHA